MQYSIATAITTILFASSTYAAVIPAKDINLQFKTGDGDASTQETVAVGALTTKDTDGALLGKAVNAFVVDSGFTCQAFSDAKGQTKLGGIFDSATTASFTDASDGGVSSDASSAVTIGSVCCAPTAQFQKVCTIKPTKTSGSSASASASASAGANNGSSGKAAGNKGFPVRIQIGGLGELATQGEIQANGKPQPLEAPLIGEDAISISIVESEKPVECTAFADLRGKKVLGHFNEAAEASFKPSDIESAACTLLL